VANGPNIFQMLLVYLVSTLSLFYADSFQLCGPVPAEMACACHDSMASCCRCSFLALYSRDTSAVIYCISWL